MKVLILLFVVSGLMSSCATKPLNKDRLPASSDFSDCVRKCRDKGIHLPVCHHNCYDNEVKEGEGE